jgi:hypothetical protein
MPTHTRTARILSIFVAPALLAASLAFAQSRPATPAHPAAPAPAAVPAAPVPALTDRDDSATQAQLIKLLRLSPKLTSVVAHDPSLLSNQDYVAQNNPELAAFLTAHPEVARNPDFYLFTHMNHEGGSPDEALERAVWPDVYRSQPRPGTFTEFMNDSPPLLAFLGFLVAFFWTLRMFIENRRWSRIFALQSEVHGKLIEKFNSTQELAAYMETDAGKRFLEAAPIPVTLTAEQRMPNAVARVLTPLQIGVVLVLLGAGLIGLRHAGPDMEIPMKVLGTVILMPGAGFIISAGITWFLAARLGLMPPQPAPGARYEAPYRPSEHN